MRRSRSENFRRQKGTPTHLKPQIVYKEIHGQIVPVKVYPPQYATGAHIFTYEPPIEPKPKKSHHKKASP